MTKPGQCANTAGLLTTLRKDRIMAAEDSIGLTLDRLRQLVHYDPETGVFTRLSNRRNVYLGPISNALMTHGHTRLRIDRVPYLSHRLAWFYVHGRWPSTIDHINGDANDNRICNLREVSHTMNMQNKRAPFKNNKCGFLGVRFKAGRYEASIYTQGKKHHLGRFDLPEEAHEAYVAAKRRLHEGCTI